MGFDRLFQVLLLFWPVAASVRTFRKMAEESCTCSLVTIMLKKLSSRSFAIKVKWSCGHNMFIHLMQNFLRKYVSLPDVKIVPLSPVLIYQLLDFIGSDAMPPIVASADAYLKTMPLLTLLFSLPLIFALVGTWLHHYPCAVFDL